MEAILLKNVIEDIRKNLDSMNRKILPKARRTKKQVFLHLILQSYNEVLIILERIQSEKEEIKLIQQKQNKWKGSGKKIDPMKLKLIQRHFDLVRLIKVDIKSLYHWTHQIEKIFNDYGIGIDISELKRISLIRHKFISHVSEGPFIKNRRVNHECIMFDAEFENIQVIYRDLSDNSIYPKIRKVAKACKVYIPELSEVNIYQEKMQIIYKYIQQITDRKTRKAANQLIESYGILTESPTKIASELLRVLLKYRRTKRV